MPSNHKPFGEMKNAWRASWLIAGFIKKTLTMEEEEELDRWILGSEQNMRLFEELTAEKNIANYLRWFDERQTEEKLNATRQKLELKPRTKVVGWWKMAAAASIVLLLATAIIYFLLFSYKPDNNEKINGIVNQSQDILPGNKYAVLKLADGRTVALKADTVINEHILIKDGMLLNSKANEVTWNELVIPQKAFFKMMLPDGSRVWLNAGSSIRYPSLFSDSARNVFVTGETFFEVAKDAAHPFIVGVNGINVQVLGTAFNINAYENEKALTATLVEGSIKVSGGGESGILKPSEQIVIQNGSWSKKTVDTDPVTAWTNNQFRLKDASIQQVMRMVERWYGAKVVYQDKVDFHFNGTISRDVPVSRLLELLEKTGNVHFRINGNEITVLK